MDFPGPTPSASRVLQSLPSGDHRTPYVLGAVICLLLALRAVRRAVAPVGLLVRAVAAAAVVAFAIGLAVMLLVLAAVKGG